MTPLAGIADPMSCTASPGPRPAAAAGQPGVRGDDLPSAAATAPAAVPATVPAAAPATGHQRLPGWLRRQVPVGGGLGFTGQVLSDLRLATVCESARCPNRMECWSQQTATFMILGDVCTRPCGFCAVRRGRTQPLADDEPQRLAEAARRLGLAHVVITSVTRDDLPDGGAEHFYRCVTQVRAVTGASVEVLTPDFLGNPRAIERVVQAAPEVFNHNTETVPRLYRRVRGRKSDYRWTLWLLRRVKQLDPALRTKSGLMLGLGETQDELLQTLAELRQAGCDLLTLGQYLQPSPDHLPVERYVPPDEFAWLADRARAIGFAAVASGPFVRSSYHAREMVAPPASRGGQGM
jgi:lipoic acid synthetase